MSHYYTEKAEPAHYEAKDGKPTTLREARKLDLVPSVTTIQGIVDKPALTYWLQKQAVKEAVEGDWYQVISTDIDIDALASQIVAAAKEKNTRARSFMVFWRTGATEPRQATR
jgi:hypothetical protein